MFSGLTFYCGHSQKMAGHHIASPVLRIHPLVLDRTRFSFHRNKTAVGSTLVIGILSQLVSVFCEDITQKLPTMHFTLRLLPRGPLAPWFGFSLVFFFKNTGFLPFHRLALKGPFSKGCTKTFRPSQRQMADVNTVNRTFIRFTGCTSTRGNGPTSQASNRLTRISHNFCSLI